MLGAKNHLHGIVVLKLGQSCKAVTSNLFSNASLGWQLPTLKPGKVVLRTAITHTPSCFRTLWSPQSSHHATFSYVKTF